MKTAKVDNWISRYIVAYPLICTLAVYVTWLAGRISLGWWPRSSLDDPKSISVLTSSVHSFTTLLLVVGFPLCLVLAVYSLLRGITKKPRDGRLMQASGISVVLLGLLFGLTRWDPLSVFCWFMD